MFEKKSEAQKYCKKCGKYQPIKTKTITCVDCGKDFKADGIVKNKTRCDECQKVRDKDLTRKRVQKYRKCKNM